MNVTKPMNVTQVEKVKEPISSQTQHHISHDISMSSVKLNTCVAL